MKRLKQSLGFGLILNSILPGAGHIYWRELLFGSFIFLVMLIAAVLFFFDQPLQRSLPGGLLKNRFGMSSRVKPAFGWRSAAI